MKTAFYVLYCGGFLALIKAQSYVPTAAYLGVDRSKVSRGSGTGVISVGYAFIVLAAFALFIILIGLMVRYLRGKGIRNEEK
ncbi:hypothetical protein X975_15493, partial [Stegodyphus mimosarum]